MVGKIVSAFDTNSAFIAIGGKIIIKEKGVSGYILNVRIRVFEIIHTILTGHYSFVGLNCALRKSAWLSVKDSICDDEVNFIFDDLDLCCHLHEIGKIGYIPEVKVVAYERLWGTRANNRWSTYKKDMLYNILDRSLRYFRTILRHHKHFSRSQTFN